MENLVGFPMAICISLDDRPAAALNTGILLCLGAVFGGLE